MITTAQGSKSPPSAIPAAALTASYIYFLLTSHISKSRAPILLPPQIFVAPASVSLPSPQQIQDGSIYITIAGNGAYLNRQQRRLQRYVVTAWAKDPAYAEIGGRVITKALHRKTRVQEESPPIWDDSINLYRVTVNGFMNTLLTGSELIY